MTEKFPNPIEKELINYFLKSLKDAKVKFLKQKFPRGIKIYVKQYHTRVTFHIYNVSDGGRG